jgi:hypothetical protein
LVAAPTPGEESAECHQEAGQTGAYEWTRNSVDRNSDIIDLNSEISSAATNNLEKVSCS